MFVRVKPSGRYKYLQVLENSRERKKVKQHVLCTSGRLGRLKGSGKLDSFAGAIVESLKGRLKRGDKALVGNKGYRKYLKVREGEAFEIDYEKLKGEAIYDGKWVLQTNTDYSAEEVAVQYKQLWMVEKAFRTVKSVLETRPVYHRCEETIRGHIFCSFLALIMMKELYSRLEEKGYHFEWDEILYYR